MNDAGEPARRTGAATGSRPALALVLGAALAFAGCGAGERAPTLANAAPSLEILVEAVLDGLADEDRAALARLLVTTDEHRELLWPELPESDDVPFEFARSMNEGNTRKALTLALDRLGGQRFEFVSVEFTKGAEEYATFTLHRGARLYVRRADDDRIGELPILDVILERDGRWKLMDYED